MGRFPGWASRVGELVVVALGHVVHLLVPGVVALRLTGALFPVAVEVDPEVLVVLLPLEAVLAGAREALVEVDLHQAVRVDGGPAPDREDHVVVALLGAIVVVLVLLGVEVKRDGVFLAFEQAVLLLRI